MYGPALTSFNKINVTAVNSDTGDIEWPGIITEENLQKNGKKGEYKYLSPSDSGARRKFYLTESNRKDFTFNYSDPTTGSNQYDFDFYTPYLDLGTQFAIKLPGYSFNVEGYAKGQPLRYTLKNHKTGEVYLVVVLRLHKEDVKKETEEEEELKEEEENNLEVD